MLPELLAKAMDLAPTKLWPTFDNAGNLDRNDFLSSSEIAFCLRRAFFNKQAGGGNESNGFAHRGHAIEAWLVDQLKRLETLGYQFLYMGENDQRTFYDADKGISGTPDGLMIDPDNKVWALEFKSIDPRFNKRNLPKRGHKYQIQQNMELIEKCLDIELDGGVLWYIDASDLFDTKEFVYEKNHELVAECYARADTLFKATSPDELEPEGILTGDCDLCSHTGKCSAVVGTMERVRKAGEVAANFSERLPSGGETLTDDELEIVHTFLYSKEEAKVYNDQIDEIKGLVIDIVRREGNTLRHEGKTLVLSLSEGRTSFDKKRAAAAGVDIARFEKVGAPFYTLKIVGEVE